jgi:hypothetical protein
MMLGRYCSVNKSMQATVSFIAVNTVRREQVINWDPGVLGGTPVFAGTRVPVQTLIDCWLKSMPWIAGSSSRPLGLGAA